MLTPTPMNDEQKRELEDIWNNFDDEARHCTDLDDIEEFVNKVISQSFHQGVQAERERWLNQPENQHDEEIRREERSRLIEIIRSIDPIAGSPNPMNAAYNTKYKILEVLESSLTH